MKRVNLIPEILFMSFFLAVLFTSCQKEDSLSTEAGTYESQMRSSSICGTPFYFNLVKQNKTDVLGTMEVSNDGENVYVKLTATAGINAVRLYYGDCSLVPSNPAHYGNAVTLAGQTTYTYTISKEDVDFCACYAARVETNGVGLVSANYCIQPCQPECIFNPGDFKTYGQGGYGSTPRGSNPGTYLLNNFASALPTGITIGCNSTISFSSAQAIMKYLPQGSTPAVLPGNLTDPEERENVFAGQVLTLALNIVFDNFDPSFGNSNGQLQNLVVASGDFQGWSVLQVLNEANEVLGGCSTNYTPSQMNDIVTAINENFEDGTAVGEILTCP